jgi:hypothetical protein
VTLGCSNYLRAQPAVVVCWTLWLNILVVTFLGVGQVMLQFQCAF